MEGHRANFAVCVTQPANTAPGRKAQNITNILFSKLPISKRLHVARGDIIKKLLKTQSALGQTI
jgi:hypothetical protein